MECFKLNVTTTVSQQVHHQFQVLGVADILCHDVEI